MGVYDTIGQLIDSETDLSAYCYARGCNHGRELDLKALARKLGRRHGAKHNDLAPKLVCSKCGSKRVGLRLGYSKAHKSIHQS
ncbi:hypothetical protein IZ6_10820 [Terrihabitans soli]|uniref:Uncharacterized protein n=1 Tax=Terrihabitans soli TaxID=708113 RepID=A0A6S6QQV2_9HYPH|nr:hypothetical protein [Terrihabitans soli]BCJ90347.1 hypothetical protein IZ6_10820 [Terrihabitans soli]